MSLQDRLARWARNKNATQEKAEALQVSGSRHHTEMAGKLEICGSYLRVTQRRAPDGTEHKVIRPNWWCNLRICTMCATWRMSVWEERVTDSMMLIGMHHRFSCRWYFMTLSLKPVEYLEMLSQYRRLGESFSELAWHKDWPYSAYIRIFNAQRTKKREANCHLHVLGMLCDCHSPWPDPLETTALLAPWSEVTGVEYEPRVELTHPLYGYDDPFIREEEVVGIVGYCMKPDPIRDDPEWLYAKATQLRGRHDVSTSRKAKALKGVLKPARRRGRPESRVQFFDSGQEPGTEIYGWSGEEYELRSY